MRAAGAAVKRHSRAEQAKEIERLERRRLSTREIAAELGLGAVYIAVAIWGFVVGDGDSILSRVERRHGVGVGGR